MAWMFDAERPIYTQVVEEITRRIICGIYAPGDRLPTVRELAAEAAVNPNTMQKAMAELESERLVYAQRTAGRFVTEDAEAIRACREKLAREKVQEFLHTMMSLGYSSSEVQYLCSRLPGAKEGQRGESVEQEDPKKADGNAPGEEERERM